jgi:hypothetical protein
MASPTYAGLTEEGVGALREAAGPAPDPRTTATPTPAQLKIVGKEVGLGLIPLVGQARDISDAATAIEEKDPVMFAMSAIGLWPTFGDLAKGTFKAIRAGDRSADTLNAGRRILDNAADAQKAWVKMGTESPYFKQWFGDSKITHRLTGAAPKAVGGTGAEPLIMYHGSRSATFTTFDRAQGDVLDSGWLGEGNYFISDPSVAVGYAAGGISDADRARDAARVLAEAEAPIVARHAQEAGEALDPFTPEAALLRARAGKEGAEKGIVPVAWEAEARKGGRRGVYPLYLDVKNPFMWGEKGMGVRGLVSKGERLPAEIHDEVMRRTGFKFPPKGPPSASPTIVTDAPKGWATVPPSPEQVWEATLSRAVREVLVERGYDGVVAKTAGGALEVVTFKPTQIKSTFNKGTFARDNPDIHASLAGAFDDPTVMRG